MESQKKIQFIQNRSRKRKKQNGKQMDIEKKTSNMADLNSIISIIILNINYLETLIKSRDSQNKECYQG